MNKKTSLSAGLVIRAMLNANKELAGKVTKIFPISIREVELPYISYRRASLEQDITKSGGADTVNIEIICYARTYEESITIAELVREWIEFKTGDASGLLLRRCFLVDSTETWADDAYMQRLIFQVKI